MTLVTGDSAHNVTPCFHCDDLLALSTGFALHTEFEL